MFSSTSCVSQASSNKVRFCCILASCFVLTLLGGLQSGVLFVDSDVKMNANKKGPIAAQPRWSKSQSKLKDRHEDEPQETRVITDGEVGSKDPVPRGMRSIVACCLLLLVMVNYIKSLIQSCHSTDKKYNLQGAIRRSVKGRLGAVVERMGKMAPCEWTNPFVLYAMLVLVVIAGYLYLFRILKAQGSKMTPPEWSLFFSVSGEGFGILWLRQSIRHSKNAEGISAKSVAIFAMLYLDTACTFPPMRSQQLDIWACKVLEIVSLVLVLDVLYSILVTNRRTYQKGFDVVPVTALIGACAVLSFLYQPSRGNNVKTSMFFTFRIFVDTFALVPQVVLMSLQDHPVHAPIAHFVGVNAMGRMVDLMYWMGEYKFWNGPLKMSSSGWIVCLAHVASLLVVADFFYYYAKTWIAKRGFITDVPIPSALDV